jgi:hypothetical protein
MVWLKDSSLKDQLQFQRRVIRIQADNKKVYCEALYADKYYVDLFNEQMEKAERPQVVSTKDLIFINGWYRQRLGLKPGDLCSEHNLNITIAKSPVLWQFYTCLQHPQSVVFSETGRLSICVESRC